MVARCSPSPLFVVRVLPTGEVGPLEVFGRPHKRERPVQDDPWTAADSRAGFFLTERRVYRTRRKLYQASLLPRPHRHCLSYPLRRFMLPDSAYQRVSGRYAQARSAREGCLTPPPLPSLAPPTSAQASCLARRPQVWPIPFSIVEHPIEAPAATQRPARPLQRCLMPAGSRSGMVAAAYFLAAVLLAASPAAVSAAAAAAAAASSASFAAAAQTVDPGGSLTVSSYRLQGDAQDSTLQLKRFEVWKPGAKVVLQAAINAPPLERAPPATRFFRGIIAGFPSSAVILTVQPDGGVSGMAYRGNASWALGKEGVPAGASAAVAATAAAAPLDSQKVRPEDVKALPPFSCGVTGAEMGGVAALQAVHPRAGNALGARKLMQVWCGCCGCVSGLRCCPQPSLAHAAAVAFNRRHGRHLRWRPAGMLPGQHSHSPTHLLCLPAYCLPASPHLPSTCSTHCP